MTEPSPGYRGRGIFVMRGSDFRIRNLSIHFDRDGTESLSPVTTEVRTDTFRHWLQVADDECGRAENARRRAVASEGDEEFAKALESEFRASLVSISASAFALDAFFASVTRKAPDTRVAADSRAATVVETFKQAFALRANDIAEIRQPIREIFRFRDAAVHPPEEFAPPAAHPVFGLGMEPRFVMFRSENAATASRFASHLTRALIHRPKSKYADLVEWCEATKQSLEEPPPST